MQTKRHITYVSPTQIDNNITNKLTNNNSTEFLHLLSLLDLYPKLSDQSFITDVIMIDIEGFYNINGIGIYDIVNTISTLCKSISNIKNIGHKTTLVATADTNTNITLLKDILTTDIKGIYPRGPEFSINEKEEALIHFFNGQYFIPQKIQSILRPKKQHKISNSTDIQLTPRQTQILSLIRNRGASNKAIAKVLNITESTVKLHITSILKKFGVRNRTQLALFKQP